MRPWSSANPDTLPTTRLVSSWYMPAGSEKMLATTFLGAAGCPALAPAGAPEPPEVCGAQLVTMSVKASTAAHDDLGRMFQPPCEPGSDSAYQSTFTRARQGT